LNPVAETKLGAKPRRTALVFIFVTVVVDVLALGIIIPVLPESLAQENRKPFSWRRANPVGSLILLRSHPELLGLSSVNFIYFLAHQVLRSQASSGRIVTGVCPARRFCSRLC
jgi:hypothetical protein